MAYTNYYKKRRYPREPRYILGDKEDLDWYPNNSNPYKRKYTGGP